ncbi:MAG: hypothetical protein HYU59_04965 [Magnetospirillum gryphiswaldense]|nr:hypothetical protein [Magnetospirillum gryphiswaldense]
MTMLPIDPRQRRPGFPFQDDFFTLGAPVGPDQPNRREDVIRVETILGNTGHHDLSRTDGPVGYWGQRQEQAVRDWQSQNGLKVDGLLKPGGPTITSLKQAAGGLLGGFTPPSPDEVDQHQSQRMQGEPGILNTRPARLSFPKPDQPLDLDEQSQAFNADSARALTRSSVNGDIPRIYGDFAKQAGPEAHATLMDLAEQMDSQVGRDRTDQVMHGIVSRLSPDQAKALLGGDPPATRPLGVRSAELPDDSAVPLFRMAAAAPAGNPSSSPSESGPAKAEPETPPTPTSPAPTAEASPPPPQQPSAPASPAASKPEQNAGAPRPQTDTEQLFGMPLPNDDDGDDTSRRARERVGARGFEVVGDDHQGPLTGAQITKSEHQQLLKEAQSEGEWGLADGGQYWLEKKLGTPPRETNLAAYKDDWVRDHATTIKVTARRHGIPPEVLAGIVHTETGGMPDVMDDIGNVVRSGSSKLPDAVRSQIDQRLVRDPSNISAGDVSIQLRHVARLEGLDPDKMTMTDRANLIDRLQSDKAYALDMAARYAKETLQQAYPGYKGGPLNDRQVMTLGYGYNMGYPNAAIDPENPNPVGIDLKGGKKSSYGPDLQRKLQRMRELLE